MILLELNDAELSLYRDGEAIYRQPAIAHVGAERNLFGIDALRIARLHPQQANQQYLARLNADPLPVPGKLAANHADLVYLHLLELRAALGGSQRSAAANAPQVAGGTATADAAPSKLWRLWAPWAAGRNRHAKRDGSEAPAGIGIDGAAGASARVSTDGQGAAQDLVAAVPGSLSTDQLGVLLGIAREAGIDIRGFVDSAVLMASASALPPRCWLLDLHLTRACLTELQAGEEVAQATAQELPGCGLMSCLDGWANLLADRFVQDTRFDPLHAADTEQQLYDQLYDWTRRADGDETVDDDFAAEIRHDGHERRVRVPGTALRAKLMQRFQQLAQKLPEDARLLVAPRSAALPGLLPVLAELSIQTESLPPDALELGFQRHAATISSGQVTLVSQLPCGRLEHPPQTVSRPKATHVLLDSQAWPLAGNPFGLPSGGQAGDTIDKDGQRLRLIAVKADQGPCVRNED